jgi:hypothetical protein
MLESTLGFGLFVRLLGLVFAFQFATTAHQLLPLVGSRGAEPLHRLLAAFRRDFGVARGALKYPTLFWLSSSDAMIRTLPWIGAACGLLICSGAAGEWNPLLFLACWIIFLSLTNSGSITFPGFPWDLLLLECGLLSVFLPASAGVLHLELVEAPGFLIHLAFILLAVRLMVGMGLAKSWWGRKEKTHKDGTYIYHMLEWQPLATSHAAWLRMMPMPVHKLLLYCLFVSELVLPWLAFIGAWGRATFAFSMVLLQIGIGIAGNYGTFNVLTIMLALPLLSVVPPWSLPSLGLESIPIYILVLLPLPVFALITTWDNGNWAFWSPTPKTLRSRYLSLLAPFYRIITPFRLFSAYGVFVGVKSIPKSVQTIQMSNDGIHWFDVVPKWQTCKENFKPRLFAPYHPRWDHYIFYYESSAHAWPLEVLTPWYPYAIRQARLVEMVIEHLYQGNEVVESIFAEVPIKSPTFIRMAMMMYSLNTPADRKRSGNYWSRSVVAISKVYPRLNLEEDSGLHAIPPDMTAFEGFAFKGRTYYRCSPDSKPVPCFQNPVSQENMVFTFNDVDWNE